MQQEITPFQFGFDVNEINMNTLLMHDKAISKKIRLTTMKNRIFLIHVIVLVLGLGDNMCAVMRHFMRVS